MQAIADWLEPGGVVADIGTDHALLLLYLVKVRGLQSAIGVENQPGPYQRAVQAVADQECESRIEIRSGNGLEPLAEGEARDIVIAGMGGDTICEIIAHDIGKASSYKSYILQPMTRAGVLRAFLASRGWLITDERAVIDHGRFYVLIKVMPGSESYSLSPAEREAGPLIMQQDYQEAVAYKKHLLDKFRRIYTGRLASNTAGCDSDLLHIIRSLEEVAPDVLPG